jgi:putative PEP-CTERM system integral membrane protein
MAVKGLPILSLLKTMKQHFPTLFRATAWFRTPKPYNLSFHAIFWLWNLAFLTVVWMGILPVVGVPLIEATFAGEIPFEFFLTLVALIAVPTICTGLGAWRFRKQPRELMRLFYGVEAPLFLLCLLRLFLLRELTPASGLILGTVAVSILAFGMELFRGYVENKPAIAWLQAATHTLMLLVGIYAGVLLLFYAVPLAAVLLQQFFSFQWVEPLWWAIRHDGLTAFWWVPIFLILFGFTSTLFLAMPSALAALYIHSGQRILRTFAGQYGRIRATQVALAVVSAWLVLFLSFGQQPQVRAFQLLENPPTTDSAKATLLAKSEVIRQGLLNANLYPYRYLSTKQENNHIREMYRSVFGLPDALCQFLQTRYNQLMSPFLYDGSRTDVEEAETLYAEFFDTPLQKAERKAVQHALQSTFNRDEVKAGLLNINQEYVWLGKQEVTVKERGDWAQVELYEVYENQTREQQEIFYYFSLPESAVLTGVWLGESENRRDRFPFTVSPRGAAQQVYNQEVRRRVDPALLEQVGPRHYRLRAFPIPPQLSLSQRQSGEPQPKLHLWLTYEVMRQEQGWALPQLGEKRNIFWTKQTERIRNAQPIESSADNWLESYLPVTGDYQPTSHQVNFPNGYQISAQPLTASNESLPEGKRFAVILDSSRSMATHKREVRETFEWLKQNGFADSSFANSDADLYVTDSINNQPDRIDDLRQIQPEKLTFYGSIQLKEMLRQFAQLRGDTPYDGIFLVTDEGSYELSDDSSELPPVSAPLWVVHLGGQLPPAYDDATLKAIQDSQGGVVTDIPNVVQRIATQEALGASAVSVADGYAWMMAAATAETTPDKEFEPLAARQLVLGLSRKMGSSLEELDAIHAIAKTHDIVTPYSSMIVLVNERQEEALKNAESKSDRFDREVESGNEQLSKPFDPLTVSGVPEPEEWMLMGLCAIGLIFIIRHQRRLAN